jgi:hypothetical protein
MPGVDRIEERDGHGKKFLRVSPRVLDEVKQVKSERRAILDLVTPGLTGIPLYRREDLPEGWPYV